MNGVKKYFSAFLNKKNTLNEKDYQFADAITKISGLKPKNLHLYKEAFSLRSTNKNAEFGNFERLEFLGDAILGSFVSCHLYSMYPNANEGFLTQMKSKIVNRKNLNSIGEEFKLCDLIQNENSGSLSENICGNLFESLVGAMYLDHGYEICKVAVLDRLVTDEMIIRLEDKIVSYKGLLLEWSQKKKVTLKYETVEESLPDKSTIFRSSIFLNNNKISTATETSKKKADEKAAQRAFYTLNKKEQIVENTKTSS